MPALRSAGFYATMDAVAQAEANGRRVAGILVPLFSLRSNRSWGIGEIADLAPFTEWLADCGHGLLQLLPVNEVSPGETSPYSSMSGFALDPIYLTLEEVEDFHELGGESALEAGQRTALERVRGAPGVDYDGVRALKQAALGAAFRRFQQCELARRSRRAAQFDAYRAEHAWWIQDYALFRAIHGRHESHWKSWAPALRQRDPAALEEQRQTLADDILFYQYVQWQAEGQWQAARQAAAARGVRLKGDLPFMVSGHSADVWAHQSQFRQDAEVGAPPDAFSADGQKWGLPPYDWEAMSADDFAWLRRRATRAAQLYDLYRVDHVVGFFRTYTIPTDGRPPHFLPEQEPEQIALGERVLRVFQAGGAEVAAEDLGIIPNFVRRSLTALGIPGYRVLRWEKEWDQYGQPFRDPAAYPALSVAVSGTHDTDTLAVWWEGMDRGERQAACRIPALSQLNADAAARFTPVVHEALLEALYGSGSRYLVLPVQDIFGTRERINLPASIGPHNWTYRMPLAISELRADPRGREASGRMAACAQRHHRWL